VVPDVDRRFDRKCDAAPRRVTEPEAAGDLSRCAAGAIALRFIHWFNYVTSQAPKILHLITDLDRGGAETMLVKLLRQMSGSGFSAIVISLAGDGAYESELRAAGIPVYALGMRPSIQSLLKLRHLIGIIRRERPDFIQTWLYHADAIGLLVAKCARLPFAWNVRNSNMDVRSYRWPTRAVRRLLTWTSHLPDAVLVNSHTGKDFHEAIGYNPRRWVLIPTGFDLDRFRPDPTAPAWLRSKLGLSAEALLIGMIARNDPMKDYPNFLAAAERVAAVNPSTQFLIAGRGTEQLRPSSALEGRVHVLGDRGDIARILSGLDILCLSSQFGEGCPNILGEAMACGVPCVATDVGDSAFVIGDTGAIVPPSDATALAACMIDWINRGADARAQAGSAARCRIEELFSIEKVTAMYRDLYAELLHTDPAALGVAAAPETDVADRTKSLREDAADG
jgi:glycosyltransferase involved in cell wall biosynthesis